jgi:Tfp pilus assembly protein PilO
MAIEFSDFAKLKWHIQGLIVVLVAGCLLGLLWYRFLSPMETEIAEKDVLLTQLQSEVARAVVRQQQLAEVRAESEALQRQLNGLKAILPLERETAEIITEIESLAEASSVTVSRVAPRAPVDQDVYSAWAWDYQFQTTYHNMGRFLDSVRNLPRIVTITGVNLNTTGDGLTTSVGGTYTATTFVYNEEEPLPTTETSNR